MRGWTIILLFLIWVGLASNGYASTVILQWDPNTESDLAGYRVYYKANSSQLPFDGAGAVEGVAPIDVAKQTTATITGLDPGADYYFAVTAYNTSGMESGYSEIIALPGSNDTTPPSVALASPVAGAIVTGAVEITAIATDDTEVRKIEVYQDDLLISAGNMAPSVSTWDTSGLPDGSYTVTAKAYDAAGNIGAASVVVSVVNDSAAPRISSFLLPDSAASLTVPVTFAATDDRGVTGYLLSRSPALPAATDPAWNATAPSSFTFSSYGTHTLYAWAKDAAGNVSAGAWASISISEPDTTSPSITAFSMPGIAASTTVSVSSFSASDDSGVTGYLITEFAAIPPASATNWTASVPTSFTFAATGTRTAYAWVKDAAGNVSSASTCTVVIDNTAPVVTGPSLRSIGPSVTIFASANDNIAVARMELYLDGFLLVQSQTDSISYETKIGKGRHSVTAKAYDAAGNVTTKSITIRK